MQNSLSVLFLCAGYGSRLKPLTDRIPKPLIKFGGKTSLEINFNQIKKLKPARIICNSHHLHKQIDAEAQRLGIETSYETELLGTAGPLGALKEALSKTEYVLVHNADILHNIPLSEIIPKFFEKGIGTLIGTDQSQLNSLCVSKEGLLQGVAGYGGFAGTPYLHRLTMTGIALYKKNFLDFCPSRVSDIKEAWQTALNSRERIYVYDSSKYQWRDFGTPSQLWEASRWYHSQNKSVVAGANQDAINLKRRVFNETQWKDFPRNARNLLIMEQPEKLEAVELNKALTPKILGKDFLWEILKR